MCRVVRGLTLVLLHCTVVSEGFCPHPLYACLLSRPTLLTPVKSRTDYHDGTTKPAIETLAMFVGSVGHEGVVKFVCDSRS